MRQKHKDILIDTWRIFVVIMFISTFIFVARVSVINEQEYVLYKETTCRENPDQQICLPFRVKIDPTTGCQYYITDPYHSGAPSITPRMSKDGRQICGKSTGQ